MHTIRVAHGELHFPLRPPLSSGQLRDALVDAVQTAVHTHRRNIDEFHTSDATGALRRFDDPDVALVEIMWRCWIAGQCFSGSELDVIRTTHATFAFVAPIGGPDRRDEARLALLQWADPSYTDATLEAHAAGDPADPVDAELTGLPWPWHRKGAPGARIRDCLGADDRVALELLAEAAARGETIPGVETLLAGADLPATTPSRRTPITDDASHFRRLLALLLKMAAGESVTPRDEIAVALEDLHPRQRSVAARRFGIESGTPERLRDIGTSMGISGERARQLLESANAKCQGMHPLLPVSMAAWRAFPHERVVASLGEWWAALPQQIRPRSADELIVLRAVEDWYWLPRAAWASCEGTWIVSPDGFTEATLAAAVLAVRKALRVFRRWGAVSVRELASAAGVHPDVARSVALASAQWQQAAPEWFIHTAGHPTLAAALDRWVAVRPRVRRRRLKALVSRRKHAGKPAVLPPAAVLAAFRRLRAPAPPKQHDRPRKRPAHQPAGVTIQPETKPMPEHTSIDVAALTGAQARYIVGMLVNEGRLQGDEVARYLALMADEIRALEARLALLRGASSDVVVDIAGHQTVPSQPVVTAPVRVPDDARLLAPTILPRANGNSGAEPASPEPAPSEPAFSAPASPPEAVEGKRRRRRPMNLSPETLASRRLQGQYLNLIRQVPAESRESFKTIAREQGRDVAIRAMEEALGQSG